MNYTTNKREGRSTGLSTLTVEPSVNQLEATVSLPHHHAYVIIPEVTDTLQASARPDGDSGNE
jgi:hypothetical protein